MKRYRLHFSLVAVLFLSFPQHLCCAEPDTLFILDASKESLSSLPEGWKNILPKNHRMFSNYSIERSIDGPYLRARSNAAASQLELDVAGIDVREYTTLTWLWKVDIFPETGFEKDPTFDDFALRLELVYDFEGSARNPINLIRKGLITSLFKGYPPELIVSYVWSINVPSGSSYASPNSQRTMIIPIESNNIIKSRWIRERRNIAEDLARFDNKRNLSLKKIRIISDTDHTGTFADGGIQYLYLLRDAE